MQAGKILSVPVLLYCVFMIIIIPVDSSAFRCGTGMVTIGESRSKVLMTCGKPTAKEKVSTAKAARKNRKKIVERDIRESSARRKYVAGVEKWIYNCGEGDFVYVLTFEDGKLKNEDTEGRGKGKSECKGK